MTDDELKQEFTAVRNFLLEFRTEVIQRFESIERRLAILQASVAGIEIRLPPLTQSTMTLEAQVANIESRLRKLEGAA